MRVSCVVLNYNDAETTEQLISQIRHYPCLDSIIIVDNCSTDDSFVRLKTLADTRLHVIKSPRNGGYGFGNNRGIRYAYERLQATHVLIANPDISVTQECMMDLIKAMRNIDRCGIVSALVKNPSGQTLLSSWKLNGFLKDLLDTGLITRRLFAPWLHDRRQYKTGRKYCRVEAVPGSMFLADAQALIECGLFDEQVFLYYEEKILGFKLRKRGYRTILLLNQSYTHMHSVSIDKNIPSILKKQAMLHTSKLYYYKKYLKLNRLEMLAARISLSYLMAEIWFLTVVCKMSW